MNMFAVLAAALAIAAPAFAATPVTLKLDAADLVWGKAALAPAGAPNDPDAVIGMAARRPLRAGAAVTARDVSALQVVKTNEVVTLTYDNGGVSLSMQAKALSAGGAQG